MSYFANPYAQNPDADNPFMATQTVQTPSLDQSLFMHSVAISEPNPHHSNNKKSDSAVRLDAPVHTTIDMLTGFVKLMGYAIEQMAEERCFIIPDNPLASKTRR
jgi:hypothetical protein